MGVILSYDDCLATPAFLAPLSLVASGAGVGGGAGRDGHRRVVGRRRFRAGHAGPAGGKPDWTGANRCGGWGKVFHRVISRPAAWSSGSVDHGARDSGLGGRHASGRRCQRHRCHRGVLVTGARAPAPGPGGGRIGHERRAGPGAGGGGVRSTRRPGGKTQSAFQRCAAFR